MKENKPKTNPFTIHSDITAGGADALRWIQFFPDQTTTLEEEGQYSFSLADQPDGWGIIAETASTLAARLFGQPLAEGKATIIVENSLETTMA